MVSLTLPAGAYRWALPAVVGVSLVGAWRARGVKQATVAVTVDGRVLPADPSPTPWLSLRRQQRAEQTVVLDMEDQYEEVAVSDLGVEPDLEATVADVRAARADSVRIGWAALAGRPLPSRDLPYRWKLDVVRAREALRRYALFVHREPVNARLDLARHERIDESPGRDLDEDATVAAWLEAIQRGALPWGEGAVVPLVVRKTVPPVTSRSLANVDVSKVLSAQETTFSLRGTGYGRAVNIRTAAKHLDGYVLGPSEVLSFNQVVGARTEANGFTHAPEIVDDEMQDGIGGGTCQVASTLHAAALFGGMEIVQRRSHRRPSSYLPLGLDATVVDGLVDLKLRNPYEVPVILHVFLPTRTSLRAEILGLESTRKVSYLTSVSEREDFFRRITFKPELPPGTIVPHQKGRQGMTVVSRLRYQEADGRAWEHGYRSEYHPVPEVFWVGPGTNESSLPDLPEGAVGIERRGEI